MSNLIKETPWDIKALGIFSAEVLEYTEEALKACSQLGFYTLRIDPLAKKALAHEYGFYYCDTLITPTCRKQQLINFKHADVSIDTNTHIDSLLAICNGAFKHGRFHRDFNLKTQMADARYNQWLVDLKQQGDVFALRHKGDLAGFIACKNGALQLHAVAQAYRGQGLAKYWWTLVCNTLFANGFEDVSSSISASNLAVLNLYSSLGFKLTKATDIYHKVVM